MIRKSVKRFSDKIMRKKDNAAAAPATVSGEPTTI
jgi:hypothetical protein